MNELDYLNYQRISEQEIENGLKDILINQNTNTFTQLFKLILHSQQLFRDFYIANLTNSDITLLHSLKTIISLCEYIITDINITKAKRNNELYLLDKTAVTNKYNFYDY